MQTDFIFAHPDFGTDFPTFTIRTLTADERDQISQFVARGKKPDEMRARLVIRKAIVGWSGLKNSHLPRLMDALEFGEKWKFKGDGRPETLVEFTADQVREISEYPSGEFAEFFAVSLSTLHELSVAAVKAELKN